MLGALSSEGVRFELRNGVVELISELGLRDVSVLLCILPGGGWGGGVVTSQTRFFVILRSCFGVVFGALSTATRDF